MNSQMYPVIGMSPGNSYFKQGIVTKLLKKALSEYERVGVFIADVPAISTYLALGYPEKRARSEKAIPQGNALRNKVLAAIETEGFDPARVRIFNWREEVAGNPLYEKKYGYVSGLYHTNSDFKTIADSTTKAVLAEHSLRKVEITEREIEIGVHYLLSEIAFMLFLPEYLSESLVGYIYHKPWPVFERFIAGEFDLPKENIRFILFPEFEDSSE